MPLLVWHHYIATIPVPVNIHLHANRLYWDHYQWYYEVDTGRIAKTECDVVDFHGDKRIEMDQLSAERKLAVTVKSASGQTLVPRRSIDMSGAPTLLSGRYLIDERRGEVLACDLEAEQSKVLRRSIPPIQNSGGTYFSLIPLEGTNRFIRDNSASGQYDLSLYAIEQDEIRFLKTWPGATSVGYDSDRVYSCRLSDRIVEVRSINDGELMEQIPFPDLSGLSQGIVHAAIRRDLLVMLDRDLVHTHVFDMSKKRMLEFPSRDFRVQSGEEDARLLLRSLYLGDADRMLIFDRGEDRVVQTIRTPLRGCEASVHSEGALLITNHAHGVSAVLIDMATGQQRARWSPFAWISWSTLLFCPLMVLWAIAWCWVSAKTHPWAWLDILLIGGVLATLASYRTSDGPIVDRSITYAAYLLVVLSILQCLTWWLVMSGAKVTTSICILLIALGLAQHGWLATIDREDEHNRWMLLVPGFLNLVYVASLAFVGRKLGRRLRGGRSHETPISVLDYMLLTVSMAVFFNSLRQTDVWPHSISINGDLIYFLLVPTLFSLFGLLIGFTVNRTAFRATLAVASVALALLVGYRVYELLTGESVVMTLERMCTPRRYAEDGVRDIELFAPHRTAEAMAIGILGPFLSAIPLRLRGWRDVPTSAEAA